MSTQNHRFAGLMVIVVMLLTLGVACGQTGEPTATSVPPTATQKPPEPTTPSTETPTPVEHDGQQAVEHYDRGVNYQEQGQLDLAIEEYTQAIALDPQLAEAYYNRGIAYGNKGDLDRAIADYGQAIALRTEDRREWKDRR